MIVSGRVYTCSGSREVGVPRVGVTDGTSVTQTDATGSYRLAVDPQAEFVYLSLPPGYHIPCDSFNRAIAYRRLADGYTHDFELVPDDRALDEFSFLYITDMHLDNDHAGLFLRETIGDVRCLSPEPAFVVFGGDITLQGNSGAGFLRALGSLAIPCFNAVGNHELLVDEADPKARYKRLFGPTYYSFNRGRFHFVVLDGTRADLARTGWKNVVGYMSEQELRWLRQDLELLVPGTPVIVFCHIPIVSSYCERRGLPADAPEPSWKIIDNQEVLAVFGQHRVLCVLQGHMHENEHQRRDSIHFLTSGSASGKWWRADNPDGSPRGYRIVRIRGEQYETIYRSTGVPNAHMSVVVTAPEKWMGRPARVDVNVFDGMPGRDQVHCQLGGRPAWELAPVPGVLHHWTGYVPLGEDSLCDALMVTLRRNGQQLAVLQQSVELEPWSPGH